VLDQRGIIILLKITSGVDVSFSGSTCSTTLI